MRITGGARVGAGVGDNVGDGGCAVRRRSTFPEQSPDITLPSAWTRSAFEEEYLAPAKFKLAVLYATPLEKTMT
jgi:hypothetical protein